MQYLFFYDCLILFSIMSSRFICVVSYCRSFFFQTKYVCVYHIFFIHSSVNGHLGHFSILVIASCKKHGNTIFFFFEILISILLVKCSKVGVLSHMMVLFLIFKGNSILFTKVSAPFCIPNSSAKRCHFLHVLANPCRFFW